MARMNYMYVKSIALLLFATGAVAQQTGQTHWVELAGSYYNSDWEFRDSELGLRLSGQLQAGPVYLSGAYNTIDTNRVDLPVIRLRGLPFGNWREFGIGFSREFAARSAWSLEGAYAGVELYDDITSGYWIGARVQRRFNAYVSGSMRLAHIELEDTDVRLTGEVFLHASDDAAVVLRIDDFAELDFTWYEIGLRWFLR